MRRRTTTRFPARLGWLALALLAALCLAPRALARQRGRSGQPEVSSMLSSGIVKLGTAVRWTVAVEGTSDATIAEVPRVSGLRIEGPSAPHVNTRIQYSPGGTSSRTWVEWTLVVRPDEVGQHTLPRVKLLVEGREMYTEELSLEAVRDMRGEELGVFELGEAPAHVYEGQPFWIDLRFGWDDDLNVQSARLIMPWWGKLRGVLDVPATAQDLSRKEVAFGLNARERIAVEEIPATTRDGRTFRSFRLRQRFLATRADTLEVPESYLEFVQLSDGARFGAQEISEYYVHLPAFSIEVRPVPEEGRPFEWSGAVGDVRAERRVDRRDVDVGDSVKLTVSWIGDANLEFFEAPDLSRIPEFAGFRVLGTESEFLGDERRVTYDLVPLSSEVTAIPPVPLWIFDAQSASFRKVETESVPIRVRAPVAASTLSPDGSVEPATDIRDIEPRRASGRELARPGGGVVGAVIAGVPLAWLVARVLVRRRRDPDAPAERARRRARRVLARDLRAARSASEQSAALARFLGARTGESEQAWLGRDPLAWARDEADGRVPEEAVRELAALVQQLDERAWAQTGGDGATLPRERVLAVADALARGGL